MAFPTPILEVALTTAPLSSSPVWVNITEQLREVQTRRGRQRELDTFDAGTASFLVDDQDRRFDSTYAGTLVNLIENPSAEVADSGFSGNTGAPTTSRSTTTAKFGTASFKAVATATGAMSAEVRTVAGAVYPATAGTTYSFSVYACGAARSFHIRAIFRDSGPSNLLISDGADQTLPAGFGSTRLTLTVTAPANTVDVRILVRSTSVTSGDEFYFDGFQMEAASAPSTYTDGSLDNCRWAGTAHASASYRGGPYYGYLLPMRKIRFGITVGATTYYLYTGYVETFQPVWDTAFTAACRIDCIDGFDIVANAALTAGTRGSELTGARVGWALDAVGWPAADRDLDTGQTTLPSFTVTAGSEPSALSHLMDVADSELGAFFIKGNGDAAFFDRHRTLKSPYTTSQATFGDTSDTDIPYEALAPSYDRDLIRNDIKITRPGGSTQTATDSSSQSAYGRRTHTRAPLLTSDTEALNMAQYLAGAYAQPALRFDSITLEPLEDDDLWTLVGDLEVWDRVTVKRTPPGGGSAIVQDCLIEGIEHRGSPAGTYWQTTYSLSPASTTQFLVLDDTVNGVLDTAHLPY